MRAVAPPSRHQQRHASVDGSRRRIEADIREGDEVFARRQALQGCLTYVLRLTATGPGGSASDEISVAVTAERYALSGAVSDSDGGTADAVHLDWSPLGGRMLSAVPGSDGAWSFGDLVAPIEQLSLRIPGG